MENVNGQRVNAVILSKNKEKTVLTVDISVEPEEVIGKEIRLTTKDILSYLGEKNILVSKCISSSVISNKNENSLFGSWMFELEEMVETDTEEVIPRYDENGAISLQEPKKVKTKKVKKEE